MESIAHNSVDNSEFILNSIQSVKKSKKNFRIFCMKILLEVEDPLYQEMKLGKYVKSQPGLVVVILEAKSSC